VRAIFIRPLGNGTISLDKVSLMGISASALESYLERLFDENTTQIIEDVPLEVSMLCLGGLFLYSLAFGYKVGRNYKR
jgi:hypothetical protein